jgi:hypothetical protein
MGQQGGRDEVCGSVRHFGEEDLLDQNPSE